MICGVGGCWDRSHETAITGGDVSWSGLISREGREGAKRREGCGASLRAAHFIQTAKHSAYIV
jgi:hypothetical protein